MNCYILSLCLLVDSCNIASQRHQSMENKENSKTKIKLAFYKYCTFLVILFPFEKENIWTLPQNDPEGQRTRSGPELRRNGRFYVRPKSSFWPKNGSYPKKSPKMTFPPLIIWAKGPFFFEQLFSVVARTWLGLKSECLFFGPKFRFLAKKSDFCHTTPILVNNPFGALGETVHYPP